MPSGVDTDNEGQPHNLVLGQDRGKCGKSEIPAGALPTLLSTLGVSSAPRFAEAQR